MSANLWGKHIKVMSFGESHGEAMGVVIDGLPAGVQFSQETLDNFLKRRRPGQSEVTTSRNESDQAEILSGIYEGKTLGSPVAVVVRNRDGNSKAYQDIKSNPRVGHADDIYLKKFGIHDYRGGGRSSGRETLSRVVAGAFCKMLLDEKLPNLEVISFTSQMGPLKFDEKKIAEIVSDSDLMSKTHSSLVRCPDRDLSQKMESLLKQAKEQGESYGGIAQLLIRNICFGLGQPVFNKFKSDLASSMMSLGAVVGFDFGGGFLDLEMPGTEFHGSSSSSRYGGMRGGVTTGEPILGRVAFKPTSSVMDVAKKGRHDPCIIPRACSVIEAMAYMCIADHLLWKQSDKVGSINVE